MVIKQHYENLKSRKEDLEAIILSHAQSYTEEINLILTVPSFKNIFSAIAVVSEIGVNMDVFRQLSIFALGQDLHLLMMKVLAGKSQ